MKLLALVSGLSALAAAAPTAKQSFESNAITFSRSRHLRRTTDRGHLDVDWLLGSLGSTLHKYRPDAELPAALETARLRIKRDTDANEPLTDQVEDGEDELYYGVGYVGSAKQKFTFDFDTGSSDAFIPGPSCGAAEGCVGSTKYDQEGENEGNTTTITYGSGEVTGENYFDSLTIAGLTAEHQNIISLTNASGFSGSASEGLIGFAFQSIAESGQPPYFFTLIDEGKVHPTEFSFFLGREASGTAQQSELTLGGRDSSKYSGKFTPVPVSSQTYWQVAVDDATVSGGPAIEGSSGQAAIDTGTTLIIAPTEVANAIYSQIEGSYPLFFASGSLSTTLFAYPCDSSPDVAFTLNGKSFIVNNLDFNFGTLDTEASGLAALINEIEEELFGIDDSGATCVGGIAGADLSLDENFYVLGDTFIKNWYATFEYVSSTEAYVNLAKSV